MPLDPSPSSAASVRTAAMTDSLRKLRALLEKRDVFQFGLLFVAILTTAVFEVVGIIAILPFMRLVAQPETLHSNAWLSRIYETGNFSSDRDMLIWMGVAVILLFSLSRLIAAFTAWLTNRSVWSMAHRLSVRLLRRYLQLPYEFFLEHNSAELLKKAGLRRQSTSYRGVARREHLRGSDGGGNRDLRASVGCETHPRPGILRNLRWRLFGAPPDATRSVDTAWQGTDRSGSQSIPHLHRSTDGNQGHSYRRSRELLSDPIRVGLEGIYGGSAQNPIGLDDSSVSDRDDGVWGHPRQLCCISWLPTRTSWRQSRF